MIAADVLRLVSGVLQDTGDEAPRRWAWEGGDDARPGLLDFLNAALRALALQRPDAFAVTEAIRLEAGMRQHLPCPGRHLASRAATGFCGLTRNLGHDGETPGAAILPVQRDILLAWADFGAAGGGRQAGGQVENFAYDRAVNPRLYYVYPAVGLHEETWVEATYYAAPANITDPGQGLGCDDVWGQALMHHVLASIFAGDSDSANLAKAGWHTQCFGAEIGTKTQVDLAMPMAKSSLGGGA